MLVIKRAATIAVACLVVLQACVPTLKQKARKANKTVPKGYARATGGDSAAKVPWKSFFSDGNLTSLIDQALAHNQELNIVMQEINIAKYEIMARRGEYLPRLGAGIGAGLEKVGEHTSQGASDDATGTPVHLQSYQLGLFASWEIDVWKKLRNAKKSATFRYLATIEGKRFLVTHLVAELAESYYELMALDNLLEIVEQNIELLKNSLKIVIIQKQGARATELAVQRFKAEVLKNQARKYTLKQRIIVTENRINFLVGRFPQPVARSSKGFPDLEPKVVSSGLPTQLLENRPDVRQAEKLLDASKLDVKVARAAFYPSLSLEAGVGYQSFYINHLFDTPGSLFYSIGANIFAPLLNRKAITANYFSANSMQIQAVYSYERAILKAFVEVSNQLAAIKNLKKRYELKKKQVESMKKAISMASRLFRSARIDYLEVLTTRRDALESRLQLIEAKQRQMRAMVKLYQALGGGWR